MTIDPEIAAIGAELVMCAEETEFSAQRGLVDELFPYIYRASKRMSTRAISRWLQESKNIKLSAATIAKALREADRYWIAFFDEVEPAAEIVARAHEFEFGRELLEDPNAYFSVTASTPSFGGPGGEAEYQQARHVIECAWINGLDDAGREECLAAVHAAERREAEVMEGDDNDPIIE